MKESDNKKPSNLNEQTNNSNYIPKNDVDPNKLAQEFEKVRTKLEVLKKNILKKYNFTVFLGLLPGNASQLFEEEETIPKEIAQTKPLHLLMVIPEEEYKNLPKIKPEVLKLIQDSKENLWLHIKTPIDLWNYGLDSKFEVVDAISASFPIHDTGFLGALRVASIHKSLVLRKFEKYVASYVIGGSLVRGTADKTSDVDTFVVIDDTDVKRMPRLELLEKLRGIIYDYIREATALAGVKNILNVQVWLLTDFWQRVKDAEPIAFTFIRDGIPLYDRGTFIPWKLLLSMGKIKPSPEAIDLYMKEGDRTKEFVKRRLLDSMTDSYYGVVTPTQALMMLVGEAPPVPKTIVEEVKKVLVEREKVMALKELKILEKAVKYFKDYEHGKLTEISGKEIDELVKDAGEYNKVLKEIRVEIEKKMQERSAEQIYKELFELLKKFFGNVSQDELISKFESEMVKKGKVNQRYLNALNEIVSIKKKIKAGKLNPKEVDVVKKDAHELMQALVEYGQRADLISSEKGNMEIIYNNGRKAELFLMGENNFIIDGKSIRKIVDKGFVNSSKEELEKALVESKGRMSTKINGKLFEILKKELGEFEIIL